MFERVKMKQLTDHIWLMDDNHEATGYLVVGRDKALVIDTMMGFENVRAIASTVTDKPVTVINTHGHCDHIFGNIWFDGALIDERDMKIASAHCQMPDFVKACAEYDLHMPPFQYVKDGDVIDLGGLNAEIISLPGHTPGGICVLLREERILFTGDSINRHLWMQLEESLPLQVFLNNMDRIAHVTQRADRILHGHAQGFEDISLFDKLREGIRSLCEQTDTQITDQDKDYEWFGGKALQHTFDEDSVIVYTRSKLNKVDMGPLFKAIDSCCGIDCSACEFKESGQCAGCKETKGHPFHVPEGSTCEVAACCIEKGKRYCADCADIPCDKLKSFANDPQHGDHPAGARIERLGRIKNELLKKARQGQRMAAVCGFCCGENCFLGQWCGWCESEYNCCSYATVMPDGICDNVRCVRGKGIRGCWECPDMEECTKGFYGNTGEPEAVNLAKAGVLFIRRFGESAFVSMLNYVRTAKGACYNDYFTDKSSVDVILQSMIEEYSD